VQGVNSFFMKRNKKWVGSGTLMPGRESLAPAKSLCRRLAAPLATITFAEKKALGPGKIYRAALLGRSLGRTVNQPPAE
jgi:hypothetical protein